MNFRLIYGQCIGTLTSIIPSRICNFSLDCCGTVNALCQSNLAVLINTCQRLIFHWLIGYNIEYIDRHKGICYACCFINSIIRCDLSLIKDQLILIRSCTIINRDTSLLKFCGAAAVCALCHQTEAVCCFLIPCIRSSCKLYRMVDLITVGIERSFICCNILFRQINRKRTSFGYGDSNGGWCLVRRIRQNMYRLIECTVIRYTIELIWLIPLTRRLVSIKAKAKIHIGFLDDNCILLLDPRCTALFCNGEVDFIFPGRCARNCDVCAISIFDTMNIANPRNRFSIFIILNFIQNHTVSWVCQCSI